MVTKFCLDFQGVEKLCDKWIEGRLRGAQESKSKEQTRTSRAVAVDYSRIRPVYSLVNETSIRISLPDIRLKMTEFEKHGQNCGIGAKRC